MTLLFPGYLFHRACEMKCLVRKATSASAMKCGFEGQSNAEQCNLHSSKHMLKFPCPKSDSVH